MDKSWLQFGFGGASLYILWRMIEAFMKNFSAKVDKLIESNNLYTQKLTEVIITNDKDQKQTLDFLRDINNNVIDTQKRVCVIDERTRQCLSSNMDGGG